MNKKIIIFLIIAIFLGSTIAMMGNVKAEAITCAKNTNSYTTCLAHTLTTAEKVTRTMVGGFTAGSHTGNQPVYSITDGGKLYSCTGWTVDVGCSAGQRCCKLLGDEPDATATDKGTNEVCGNEKYPAYKSYSCYDFGKKITENPKGWECKFEKIDPVNYNSNCGSANDWRCCKSKSATPEIPTITSTTKEIEISIVPSNPSPNQEVKVEVSYRNFDGLTHYTQKVFFDGTDIGEDDITIPSSFAIRADRITPGEHSIQIKILNALETVVAPSNIVKFTVSGTPSSTTQTPIATGDAKPNPDLHLTLSGDNVKSGNKIGAGESFFANVKYKDTLVGDGILMWMNYDNVEHPFKNGQAQLEAPKITGKSKEYTIRVITDIQSSSSGGTGGAIQEINGKGYGDIPIPSVQTTKFYSEIKVTVVNDSGVEEVKVPDSFWNPIAVSAATSGAWECFNVTKDASGRQHAYFLKFNNIWGGVLCAYETFWLVTSLFQAGNYVWSAGGWGDAYAEEPLTGTAHCNECNMPYTVCTEQRCKILGSCNYILNADGRGGVCVKGVCEPTTMPQLTRLKADFLIDRSKLDKTCPSGDCTPKNEHNGMAYVVKNNISYLVDEMDINLTTNQLSKCKYVVDKPGTPYDDMQDFDNVTNFATDQGTKIDLSQLELGQEHTVYIKCVGTCGEKNETPGYDWNYVRFRYESKPDQLPPVIVNVVPDPFKQYWSSESHNETIEVWLDEKGYCKFSTPSVFGRGTPAKGANLTTNWSEMEGAGKSYGLPMPPYDGWNVISTKCIDNQQCCSAPNAQGEITCFNKTDCSRCYLNVNPQAVSDSINWSEIQEMIANGTIANYTKIPQNVLNQMIQQAQALGLDGNSKISKYMFRCADDEENVMLQQDSYYFLMNTYPPFDINITVPPFSEAVNGDNFTTYNTQPPIEVNSSRISQCKYAVDRGLAWDNMTFIDQEFSLLHDGTVSQNLSSSPQGTPHKLYVRCRDRGGLEETSMVDFTVIQDVDSPKIIRMYKNQEDGLLYLETNEEGDCVYTTKSCAYNFTDGSPMMTVDKYLHAAPWTLDNLYYVKCVDKWNNYPDAPGNAGHSKPDAPYCTIIILPYEVPESP